MKDKQKRKKERTWAEAARLVRRAALGGSFEGVGVGSPRTPTGRGRGRGEALPTARGAGPLSSRPRQPPRALGGERFPAGLDVAPFSARHPPPQSKFLRRGELAGWLLPLLAAQPQPPLPHYLAASGGLGKLGLCTPGELGFREGSEAPPLLPGGVGGGAFDSRGGEAPPAPRTRVAF